VEVGGLPVGLLGASGEGHREGDGPLRGRPLVGDDALDDAHTRGQARLHLRHDVGAGGVVGQEALHWDARHVRGSQWVVHQVLRRGDAPRHDGVSPHGCQLGGGVAAPEDVSAHLE
jgi:hypothetical protein